MDLAPGLAIGKYVLGTKLGEGGFGAVYVARDTGLDRDVALKFLHAEHTRSPDLIGRFLQEARSAAKIAHPGIVTIYEAGQVAGTGTPLDGTAFIAMEMLQGESLTARVRREGRLAPAAAIEICRQIASALEAAHKAGIVHRDLKPDNVYLVPDPVLPSGERIKVLDFGIAKLAQASSVHTLTAMVMGTPRYMSPEQCRSSANIDHRSDIYTLGCILFELICGRPPFDGEAGELIAMHQLVEPPSAGSLVQVPAPVDELITTLLAKQPTARPQSMAQVQQALERQASLPGLDTPAPLAPPAEPTADASPPTIRARPAPPPAAHETPTTMSGAAGSRSGDGPARPRRTPVLAIALVGVAAAGSGAWFLTRSGGGGGSVPADAPAVVATSPVASPAAADASVVVATTPVDAPVDAAVPVDAPAPVDAAPPDAPPVTRPRPPPPPPPPPPKENLRPFDRGSVMAIIQRCRLEFLRANPGDPPSGTLVVDAKLTGNKASGTASGVSTEIASCVTRTLASTRFEPGAQDTLHVQVTWRDPLRPEPPGLEKPPRRSPVTRQVDAGPIWDDQDAQTKCAAACAPPSRWTGGWRTTVAGKMSTCDCVTP